MFYTGIETHCLASIDAVKMKSQWGGLMQWCIEALLSSENKSHVTSQLLQNIDIEKRDLSIAYLKNTIQLSDI